MRQLMTTGDEMGPWNPADRLQNMRSNYETLVQQLNISPRGGSHGGVRLPRVPVARAWPSGSKSPRGPGKANKLPAMTLRSSRGAADTPSGAVPGSSAEVPAWGHVFGKLDELTTTGQLSTDQAARLQRLGLLQVALPLHVIPTSYPTPPPTDPRIQTLIPPFRSCFSQSYFATGCLTAPAPGPTIHPRTKTHAPSPTHAPPAHPPT